MTTQKYFELVPDETFGRDMKQALRNIQAEAERNGVPPGTQPELRMDSNLVTTYRWEWEEGVVQLRSYTRDCPRTEAQGACEHRNDTARKGKEGRGVWWCRDCDQSVQFDWELLKGRW